MQIIETIFKFLIRCGLIFFSIYKGKWEDLFRENTGIFFKNLHSNLSIYFVLKLIVMYLTFHIW